MTLNGDLSTLLELALSTPTVCYFRPGPVKTPIYRQLGIVNDAAAAQLEALVLEMTAQTRFAGPEEILAYAIVFLASKAASAITGCCIEADCGWQVYGGPRGENK